MVRAAIVLLLLVLVPSPSVAQTEKRIIQRRERVMFGGASKPAPPPPPAISEAERTWSWIKDTNDRSMLENFIKQFGDTPFGAMARARIDELKRQQVAVAQGSGICASSRVISF